MVKILEKPDYISWNDLAELQYKAHADNRSNGVDQNCAHMNGEQLRTSLGDGKCIVAIVDGNLVGMACYQIIDNFRGFWFCNGKRVASLLYTAILPEYQKGAIFFKLIMTRNMFLEEDHAEVVITDTHFKNNKMRELFRLYGYKEVLWKKFSSCKYYSVVYARWINECPYTDAYIKKRYVFSKLIYRFLVNKQYEYTWFAKLLLNVKRILHK